MQNTLAKSFGGWLTLKSNFHYGQFVYQIKTEPSE